MENCELRSTKRAIDLALAAARKRQSPRTGFLHLCLTDELATDTIPLFENFCFTLALFRQRTVEAITEGKKILERLLAFQTAEGNFPIYLHDFPHCYDNWMALRIAPVLVQIHRHFTSVIGTELKQALISSLDRLLRFSEARNRPPLWEHRFRTLQGEETDFSPVTHEEWYQWVVSQQLSQTSLNREIPYDSRLQAFIGGPEVQEKGEPRPFALEWALAEKQGFSERLLKDHPALLQAALLFPIDAPIPVPSNSYTLIPEGVRLLWNGNKKLHTLCAPSGKLGEPGKISFDLSHPTEVEKGDLIEAAFFCDLSSETEVFIDGKKGTVFNLGAPIQIHTPTLKIDLRFDLVQGQGDFSGQISRANRPSQVACKGALQYEVFDWRISLRTLRRSPHCLVVASMAISES